MLYRNDFVRPFKIGSFKVGKKSDAGKKHTVKQRQNDYKNAFCRGGLQNNHRADSAEKHGDFGKEQVHFELCAERLPRFDGHGLRNPDGFAFKRNGGCGHIVHGSKHTHSSRGEHSYYSAFSAEGDGEHGGEHTPFYKQQHRRNGQHDYAESAVEHIVRACGKAHKLLAQQRRRGACLLCGGFFVLDFLRRAGGGGDFDKSAGEYPHGQRHKHRGHNHDNRRRDEVALAHFAKDVERVRRRFYAAADGCRIFNKALEQLACFEIEEIICRKERKGHNNGDEAFIFKLEADFRHDPAKKAGENQNQRGNRYEQQQTAEKRRNAECVYKINYNRGQQHHC